MGSISAAGYNRGVDTYGWSSYTCPYIGWNVTWNTGNTVFTITASKPSSSAEMGATGLSWTGYIWFGDFYDLWGRIDQGEEGLVGNYIQQWTIKPDTSTDPASYSTTVSLGITPHDSMNLGFTCLGTEESHGLGFLTGYVNTSTTWNPLRTITVREVKKTVSGAAFADYDYYPVEMHSSWTAAQLRPPSEHQHIGYEYVSCTSVNDIQVDTTLYLIYNPLTYYVSYNANTAATVSNIPPPGYVEFEGNVSPYGEEQYPLKYYTVTLNPTGGVLNETTLISTAQFNCWRTEVNGITIDVDAGSTYIWTQDLAFYARWGAMSPVILPVPTKIGYNFVTWGVTSTATSGYAPGSFTPDEDIELFAIWESTGIIQIYHDGAFTNHLVWLYKGDGGGPNHDGWHHVMPKLYCTQNNVTQFYNVGGGSSGGGSSAVILPTITASPSSITAPIGDVASFSVSASGSNISYQWQYYYNGSWVDITSGSYSGLHTSQMRVTATSELSGTSYRCAVSNAAGTVYSDAASLTTVSIPVINTQPRSISIKAGSTASFSVVASGSRISYQWYYRTSSSGSWVILTDATGSSYSFTGATYNNGYQYYCKVSNANGSINSDVATLSVSNEISAYITVNFPVGADCTATNGSIILQPTDINSTNGVCHFSIASGGNWTFNAVDGSNSASTTITIADGDSRTITLSYGSSTTISATVCVQIPDGATSCVMRKGTTTVQPTTSSGGTTFIFNITEPGPWVISATNGINNVSQTVIIANGDNLNIELEYSASGGGDENAPSIVVEPTSQTIAAGTSATFSISANGSNLTYQWYYRTSSSGSWTRISGASSASYTISASAGYNGYQYRCVVSNTYGSVTSSAATLTVISAPTITTHPASTTVVVNSNATFTVVASGTGLSYQWQYRTSSSGSWTNINDATNASYGVTATASNDKYQYRCVVSNLGGSVNSNAATLTSVSKPTITKQPTNQVVSVNYSATFSLTASGYNLSYQWYYRTSSSGSWTSISGATSSSYTVTGTSSNNGYQYRCIVTNAAGTATSNAVTLTAVTSPVITEHPASQAQAEGIWATFTVTATGYGLSYQWQCKSGSSWTNLDGENSSVLIIAADSSNNGNQYRCVVTNIAGSATSNAATLTSVSAPVITVQPTASQTVGSATSVTLSVTATGYGLNYQWYYTSSTSGTWSAISEATSASYTFTTPTPSSYYDNYIYYCAVSNIAGTTNSDAAAITVVKKGTISTQPSSVTVAAGNEATFYIIATGLDITFQWQRRTSSSGSWSNISGATDNTYTISSTTSSMNGYQYRCRVNNAGGNVYSNVATLTVLVAPSITTQPTESQTVGEGASVTLSVTASGTNPSYQWYSRTTSNGSWSTISGATSASYTFTAPTPSSYYAVTYYYCKVSNAAGTDNSDAAAVTVVKKPTITTQPSSQSASSGGSASFYIVATGLDVRYQWQRRTSSSGSWSNISGATDNSYSVSSVTMSMNGYQYRCAAINTGGTVYSNAATLTVNIQATVTVAHTKVGIVNGSIGIVGASDCRMTHSSGTVLYRSTGNDAASVFIVTKAGSWTITASGFKSKTVTVSDGDSLDVTLEGT